MGIGNGSLVEKSRRAGSTKNETVGGNDLRKEKTSPRARNDQEWHNWLVMVFSERAKSKKTRRSGLAIFGFIFAELLESPGE